MKLQKTSAIMSLLFGSTFPQVQKDWPTLSSRFTTKMTTSHKQRITSCFDKNTNSNYPCLCENGYIDAIQKCRKTSNNPCDEGYTGEWCTQCAPGYPSQMKISSFSKTTWNIKKNEKNNNFFFLI